VDIPFLRYLYKRLLRPDGLVIVVGILTGLAVKGDKPLDIPGFYSPYIADSRDKIEHIPYKASPHKISLRHIRINRLVIEGLKLFCVVVDTGSIAVKNG